MERIVIEVDDATAKKWRHTSFKAKQRLYSKIDQLLQVSLPKPEDNFWEFVDEIRKEAQANGITEEELQRILNDD